MPRAREKKSVIVAWLLPAAEEREFFQGIINRLAHEFDAPRFQPHLTLGVLGSPDAEFSADEMIALTPAGVFSKAIFTRTLFVRFGNTDSLWNLRASLGLPAGDYDPHLSLLYSRLPSGRKASLISSIRLPFPKVRFDRLALVCCLSPTETKAEVESWRVLQSIKLRP